MPPSALTRLLSRVSIFPSAESFMVELLLTLPLVFSVTPRIGIRGLDRHRGAPGSRIVLAAVLKVYDWPSMVTFISPPGI